MNVIINVTNQKLAMTTNLKSLVAGTQKFVRFVFNLTDEWDDLMPFAQFVQNGVAYNEYLDENNSVYLPPEISAGSCTLMLYGSNNGVIGTTNCLTLQIDENHLVSDASSTEISHSLYDQLVSRFNEVINGVKGEPFRYEDFTPEQLAGLKGEKGDKGDKPVKGTDYFTEDDKTELVNSVLNSLPTWQGGEY